MNKSWNHITFFTLQRNRIYQCLVTNKCNFYDKGTKIKRVSEWRDGFYFDSGFVKIKSKYADFYFPDGSIRDMRYDDEIEPVEEQMTFDF
jgi:hypothetical protein